MLPQLASIKELRRSYHAISHLLVLLCHSFLICILNNSSMIFEYLALLSSDRVCPPLLASFLPPNLRPALLPGSHPVPAFFCYQHCLPDVAPLFDACSLLSILISPGLLPQILEDRNSLSEYFSSILWLSSTF
jgi:hypothetical protein